MIPFTFYFIPWSSLQPLKISCLQLLHTLSKMYLSVSTTTTSRTESTNLLVCTISTSRRFAHGFMCTPKYSIQVKLRPENIKGCIFKILPQYKVRAVGDEVKPSSLTCHTTIYGLATVLTLCCFLVSGPLPRPGEV